MHPCEKCDKVFGAKRSLLRHVRSAHDGMSFNCVRCQVTFRRRHFLMEHIKKHEEPMKRKSDDELSSSAKKKAVMEGAGALKGTAQDFDLFVDKCSEPLDICMEDHREDIRQTIEKQVAEKKGVKWTLIVKVRLIRPDNWHKDDVREAQPYFRSKTCIAIEGSDVNEDLKQAFTKIMESKSEFIREGSGWIYDCLLSMKINVATYAPLAASSYVSLPKELLVTKAIINVKNEDDKCFLWSVLAFLHPQETHSERIFKYKSFEHELNVTGMDFPLPISQVGKFASLNDLSINVYGYEKKDGLYPLYICNNGNARHVDLLLISQEENRHYCLIKNLSRLLSHLTKHNGKAHPCKYCLHRFTRQDLLDKHQEMCKDHDAQKIVLPEEGKNIMKFTNIKKQLQAPFIIYADFESFAEKIQGPLPEETNSSTTLTSKHVPSGFCFVVISPNGSFFQPPVVYHGTNVVEIFFQKLTEVQSVITPLLHTVTPLKMTDEDDEHFHNATYCHICLKPYTPEDIRVRDHDHLPPGKYRGSAHQNCNIQYQLCDYIPVVFHNLRYYDAHILMQGIGRVPGQRINCIANTMEKYISFSLGNLRFIDSLQFLSASLDTLVNNLCKNGPDAFSSVRQYFPEDKLSLLLRKGVFPYSHLDSVERFEETQLPSPEAFFNQLTQTGISPDDYQHALAVWDAFQMKNFGEYHDLYNTLDVLLLADVFENFRKVCLQNYRLDPAHYYTSPGLAWDACLLKTGVELELFTDPDMYLFVEKGIRGGISMITHRYSKANNPYLEDFKEDEPRSYISYTDMNNLYGCAMIESLPVRNFQWMEDVSDFDVHKVSPDSTIGYIIQVDLQYPVELHDSHSDYPLAPERMQISEDMLSPYSKDLLKVLGMKHMGNVQKLVPNLQPKKNYVVHYRNLQLYLSLGMKLLKIHRILQFEQQPWLKPYIEFNTEKRKQAANDFEKDFFKLLNNAVFGKSMEDPRKHINVHLVNDPKQLKKLVAKPSYKASRIFSEDLVGVELRMTTLKLNKPIYTGLTILDISKLLMYDFHYNHMLPNYGSRMKLNFTDTDSFCYTIQTDDVYRDMQQNIHLYDTSDYSKHHFLHSSENKKVLGKFKDEVSTGIIQEFVGLRPKCYSILTTVGEKKTAKGVGKTTTKRDLVHEKYRKCLLERKIIMAEMNRILCTNHQLYSANLRKIGLSPADDKRYVLDDGVTTLAHGHYRIKDKV